MRTRQHSLGSHNGAGGGVGAATRSLFWKETPTSEPARREGLRHVSLLTVGVFGAEGFFFGGIARVT
jgi:hypothetical protein